MRRRGQPDGYPSHPSAVEMDPVRVWQARRGSTTRSVTASLRCYGASCRICPDDLHAPGDCTTLDANTTCWVSSHEGTADPPAGSGRADDRPPPRRCAGRTAPAPTPRRGTPPGSPSRNARSTWHTPGARSPPADAARADRTPGGRPAFPPWPCPKAANRIPRRKKAHGPSPGPGDRRGAASCPCGPAGHRACGPIRRAGFGFAALTSASSAHRPKAACRCCRCRGRDGAPTPRCARRDARPALPAARSAAEARRSPPPDGRFSARAFRAMPPTKGRVATRDCSCRC